MQVVECPSGLVVEVRNLKTREAKILADSKLASAGKIIDSLLGACTLKTVEAGPAYSFADVDWSKTLIGDRFHALMQVRIASFGEEYDFKVRCERGECKHQFKQFVNLLDLEVRKLPPESAKIFRDSNRFETRIPSTVTMEIVEIEDKETGNKTRKRMPKADTGTKIWFKLLVGEDESRAQVLQNRVKQGKSFIKAKTGDDAFNPALESLVARIIEIEGIEQHRRRNSLEDLDLRDHLLLVKEFDRVDCGVETDISVDCPACGWEQEVSLPLERNFFFPTTS